MALLHTSSAPFALSPVLPQLFTGNIWRQNFSDTTRSGFHGGSITQCQDRNSQSEHVFTGQLLDLLFDLGPS